MLTVTFIDKLIVVVMFLVVGFVFVSLLIYIVAEILYEFRLAIDDWLWNKKTDQLTKRKELPVWQYPSASKKHHGKIINNKEATEQIKIEKVSGETLEDNAKVVLLSDVPEFVEIYINDIV